MKPLEKEIPLVYDTDFRLAVTDEEKTEFKEYMMRQGVDFTRLVVLCTPFTRVADKKWDMQKMKEVMSGLVWKYDAQLIINYSREEKADAMNLFEEMRRDKHIS